MTILFWEKWPERWQMAEEYLRGDTVKRLSIRYRRDPSRVSKWLRSLGIIRTSSDAALLRYREKEPTRSERPITPQIRQLAVLIDEARDLLGFWPTGDSLTCIIEEIRKQNGGRVHVGKRGVA